MERPRMSLLAGLDGKLRRALIIGNAESEFIRKIDRLGDIPVVHPAVFSKDVISGDKPLMAGNRCEVRRSGHVTGCIHVLNKSRYARDY